MRVAVVTAFYSEGMGYTENCLPKNLAALGHDVHVLTSRYNVYGTSPEYESTYRSFLGPADQGVGRFETDGYTVHRLDCGLVGGYVAIKGLTRALRSLRPEIVHCTEIASLPTFTVAAARPFLGFKLFAESHQHLSVVKPYLREPSGSRARRLGYWATRTLPSRLASLAIERCYAIAPDCLFVANRFYGVPLEKMKLQQLGTDTELFSPASTPEEREARASMRLALGYSEDDVVCIYTGRLTAEKNPLVLAKAVETLSARGERFRSLFVGAGGQSDEIALCRGATVLPFVRYSELPTLYRAADIAVWPRQESMSMLDAAACGLPLVVADTIGDNERVTGNGRTYVQDDVSDLARVLGELTSRAERVALGAKGRSKMVTSFSWRALAESVTADYSAALQRR